MTTLTAPLPLVAREPPGLGGPTLGQRLEETWRELHDRGGAACPACGERMELASGAGRCGVCGSQLR